MQIFHPIFQVWTYTEDENLRVSLLETEKTATDNAIRVQYEAARIEYDGAYGKTLRDRKSELAAASPG